MPILVRLINIAQHWGTIFVQNIWLFILEPTLSNFSVRQNMHCWVNYEQPSRLSKYFNPMLGNMYTTWPIWATLIKEDQTCVIFTQHLGKIYLTSILPNSVYPMFSQRSHKYLLLIYQKCISTSISNNFFPEEPFFL